MAGVAEILCPPGELQSRVFGSMTCYCLHSIYDINIFKDVLDQIVYLAILMPIVASMGGVAAPKH